MAGRPAAAPRLPLTVPLIGNYFILCLFHSLVLFPLFGFFIFF